MLLCCLMLFGLVFTVSADPDQPEVDPVAHAITVTTALQPHPRKPLSQARKSPLPQKPTRASDS